MCELKCGIPASRGMHSNSKYNCESTLISYQPCACPYRALKPHRIPFSIKLLAESYFERGWMITEHQITWSKFVLCVVDIILRKTIMQITRRRLYCGRDLRSSAGSLLGYCSVVAYKSRSAIIMSHHPRGHCVC